MKKNTEEYLRNTMSDHSDLVARLRNIDKESVFSIPYLCSAAADALDVKPGANADLIAEARNGPPNCDRDCCDMHPNDRSCVDCKSRWASSMVERLADALEAADSHASVLPTREQIIDAIQEVCRKYFLVGVLADRNRKCAGCIADAVLALFTGGKSDL